MGDAGRDLTGIAMALIGVALVALLVGHSSGTTAVVQATSQGFNSLLQTVTLQGSNGFASNTQSFGFPGA